MPNIIEESKRIKKSIETVVSDVIDDKTRSCFRLYKAIVISAPESDSNNKLFCDITLIGEETVLHLPCSTAVENVIAGDIVWIAVLYNSWNNAIVWVPSDFNLGGGLTTIPIATTTTIGGIKSQNGSNNGVDYPVQVNDDGTARVNIPVLSKEFVKDFVISDWNEVSTGYPASGYVLTITQYSENGVEGHGLTNPYVSAVLLNQSRGNEIINEPTNIDFSYKIGASSTVKIYITVDLSKYSVYSGQILLKEI